MSKIPEYPAASRVKAEDVLLVDGTGGTRKVAGPTLAVELQGLTSAVHHRNVFRGKNLGGSVTSTQWTAISSGTFDDLYIGDYWNIKYGGGNTINFTIADMDYYYGTGYSGSGENYSRDRLHKHHLVIVPSENLTDAYMNAESKTEGGYVGSEMYTGTLETVETGIKSLFGDNHVLPHYVQLTNAVEDGHTSGCVWKESTVELMNEWMVYGAPIYAPMNDGVMKPVNYTVDKTQLALFRLNPRAINIEATYWLRDVVSSTHFARVDSLGVAAFSGASTICGVRPVFIIG